MPTWCERPAELPGVERGHDQRLRQFANFAGSYDSLPVVRTYRIEFFANAAADPGGFGEGQRYLGFTNVTTDAAGNAIIGVTLATGLAVGEFVTATATDPVTNDTSEFSAAILACGELVVTTTADTIGGNTASVPALIANPGPDGRISLREAILATNGTIGPNTIRFGIPLTDADHSTTRTTDPAPSRTSRRRPSPTSHAVLARDHGLRRGLPIGQARSWYRIQLGRRCPPSPVPSPSTPPPSPSPFPVRGRSSRSAAWGTLRWTCSRQLGEHDPRIRHRPRLRQRHPHQGSSNNVIAGNYLGTNVTGTAAAGNVVGVFIGGVTADPTDNNRVGGTTAADRNVISGNSVDGIQINDGAGGAAANNVVQGNYIGTDVTGTLDLGNTNQGVAVFGTTNTNNVIGGTAPGAGNVISGNDGHGVGISNAGTTGTLVQGNRIGTNAAGTAGIPNFRSGVRFDVSPSNNTVGGTAAGAGNIIAYNNPTNIAGNAGIVLNPPRARGNSILGNVIHSNGGLGIDLSANGVTPNDPTDGDAGPNDLLNFPLISAVHSPPGH